MFVLDHIVHLSSPGKLDWAVKEFQELGFDVITGGEHADGLTENALIVLADGVYLELIQFLHPPSHYDPEPEERKAREGHWWASMQENNWIDFCLTDLTDENGMTVAEEINSRARDTNVEVEYAEGVKGGRIKPDGDTIRWLVTFPSKRHLRGSVPFFCKDLTPREKRVPRFSHKSEPVIGAERNANLGRIAMVSLLTNGEDFSKHSVEISTVLGSAPRSDDAEGSISAFWTLDSPDKPQSIRLCLTAAKTDDERTWVQSVGGIGLWKISLKGPSDHAMPTNRQPDAVHTIGRVEWVH